jgi:putative methionine-R-sulfoxide reductase with GAF domain
VVPLEFDGRQFGVLDLDAPVKEWFDASDREGLEAVVRILLQGTNWPENIGEPVPPA